eukprot:GHVQ01005222.1.p1 GENE.GHVQ01005222.1~~GHVQ01005222.1.p1  ORF type:complete len:824 (+),score=73.63 GHVQ01005222.1:83-2554(+)
MPVLCFRFCLRHMSQRKQHRCPFAGVGQVLIFSFWMISSVSCDAVSEGMPRYLYSSHSVPPTSSSISPHESCLVKDSYSSRCLNFTYDKRPPKILFLSTYHYYLTMMDRWYYQMFEVAKDILRWEVHLWGPGFPGFPDDDSDALGLFNTTMDPITDTNVEPCSDSFSTCLQRRFGSEPFDLILLHWGTYNASRDSSYYRDGLPRVTLFAIVVHEWEDKQDFHTLVHVGPDLVFNTYLHHTIDSIPLRLWIRGLGPMLSSNDYGWQKVGLPYKKCHDAVYILSEAASRALNFMYKFVSGGQTDEIGFSQQQRFTEAGRSAPPFLSSYLPHGIDPRLFRRSEGRCSLFHDESSDLYLPDCNVLWHPLCKPYVRSEDTSNSVHHTLSPSVSCGNESENEPDLLRKEAAESTDVAFRHIDIGMVGSPSFYYPLRIIMNHMILTVPTIAQHVESYSHPGYAELKVGKDDANEQHRHKMEEQYESYVSFMQKTKICLIGTRATWTLRKYVEAMAAGCLVVGDVPDNAEIAKYVVPFSFLQKSPSGDSYLFPSVVLSLFGSWLFPPHGLRLSVGNSQLSRPDCSPHRGVLLGGIGNLSTRGDPCDDDWVVPSYDMDNYLKRKRLSSRMAEELLTILDKHERGEYKEWLEDAYILAVTEYSYAAIFDTWMQSALRSHRQGGRGVFVPPGMANVLGTHGHRMTTSTRTMSNGNAWEEVDGANRDDMLMGGVPDSFTAQVISPTFVNRQALDGVSHIHVPVAYGLDLRDVFEVLFWHPVGCRWRFYVSETITSIILIIVKTCMVCVGILILIVLFRRLRRTTLQHRMRMSACR